MQATVATPPPSEEELNPYTIFPKPEDNYKVNNLSIVLFNTLLLHLYFDLFVSFVSLDGGIINYFFNQEYAVIIYSV